MRGVLLAGIAAVAAAVLATLATRHATRQEILPPAAQPREARLEDLARDVVAPADYARANSFWGETSIGPCMVSAHWRGEADGAAFTSMLRLAVRAPLRAAAVPARAGAWVAREQLELAATGDADIASRYTAVEPGVAPVVRVLRFQPRAKATRAERRYDTLRAA